MAFLCRNMLGCMGVQITGRLMADINLVTKQDWVPAFPVIAAPLVVSTCSVALASTILLASSAQYLPLNANVAVWGIEQYGPRAMVIGWQGVKRVYARHLYVP